MPCDTVTAKVVVPFANDVAAAVGSRVLVEFPETTTVYSEAVLSLLEDVMLVDAPMSELEGVDELVSDDEELVEEGAAVSELDAAVSLTV